MVPAERQLLLFSPMPLQQGARPRGHRGGISEEPGAHDGEPWGWSRGGDGAGVPRSPVLPGLHAEPHAHPAPTHWGEEGAIYMLV